MQVRKLCEHQGIKPATKQTNADARIATFEAKLGIASQPKEGDVKKKEGETPKEPQWGKNWGNFAVTHQSLHAKSKEPG